MARKSFVNDDEDLGGAWREYRRAQQERRAARLPVQTEAILALRGKGFDVRQITDYQFRIDGALDLYPIHRRFHDLRTQRRGTRAMVTLGRSYREPMDIAVRTLRTPRAVHS